jgi:chromate transporter
MRNSPSISVFLDAVNVASVAIIVAICWEMGRDSILDWRTY